MRWRVGVGILIGGVVWGATLSVVNQLTGVYFYNFYRSFRAGENPTTGRGVVVAGYYTHRATREEIAEAREQLRRLVEEGLRRAGGGEEFQRRLEGQLKEQLGQLNPPQWMSGVLPREWAAKGGAFLFRWALEVAPKVGEFETPVGRLGEVGIVVVEPGRIRKIPIGVDHPVTGVAIGPAGEIGVVLDYSGEGKIGGRLVVYSPAGRKVGDWLFRNLSYQLEFAPDGIVGLLFTDPSSRWWERKGLRFFNYKTGHFVGRYLIFSGAGTPNTAGLDLGFTSHPPYFQFTADSVITADGKVYYYPSLHFRKQLGRLGLVWGVSPDLSYLISDRHLYRTDRWESIGELDHHPYTFQFNPATAELWVTLPFLSSGCYSLSPVFLKYQLPKVVAPTPVGEWVVGVGRHPLRLLLFRRGERRPVASYPLPGNRVRALLPLSNSQLVVILPDRLLLLQIKK